MNLDPVQCAQIPMTSGFHDVMAKLCDIHPVTYSNKKRIIIVLVERQNKILIQIEKFECTQSDHTKSLKLGFYTTSI